MFEHGFDARTATWLLVVLVGTGIAGLRGRLPGCEPAPYIIRFTEDRPNPLYRRICYTTAWGEVVAFAVLNVAGLAYAVATGEWRLKQMYEVGYFPIAGTVWALGAMGFLPRVRASTANEGHERRYFYGSVWAVAIAQPVVGLLWKVLPQTRGADLAKLLVFVCILALAGYAVAGRSASEDPANPAGRVGDRLNDTVDALVSPTLKHLREHWWDDEFTEFLAETLRPRPGNRILDVGCGEGLAEVAIGRLQISQVRLYGVDLVPSKAAEAKRATESHNQRVRFSAGDARPPPLFQRILRFDVLCRRAPARAAGGRGGWRAGPGHRDGWTRRHRRTR